MKYRRRFAGGETIETSGLSHAIAAAHDDNL
jgi:hypothetical protein